MCINRAGETSWGQERKHNPFWSTEELNCWRNKIEDYKIMIQTETIKMECMCVSRDLPITESNKMKQNHGEFWEI